MKSQDQGKHDRHKEHVSIGETEKNKLEDTEDRKKKYCSSALRLGNGIRTGAGKERVAYKRTLRFLDSWNIWVCSGGGKFW